MFSEVVRSKGLRFDVVGQVLLAIFRGQLRSGDRLIARKLAADFGVSATPAREALLELASFGMVDLLPNRGAVVLPFGPRQLKEIYDVRALLEAEAARLACGQISVAELNALRVETIQLIEDQTIPHWSERSIACDRGLHALIAQGANQHCLQCKIEHFDKLVKVARGLLEDTRRLQLLAHTEHLKLIDALLAGDPEEAAKRMREHIHSACSVLIEEAFPQSNELSLEKSSLEFQPEEVLAAN